MNTLLKAKSIAILIATLLVMISGCKKEDFAEINSNPGDVTTPDVRYLFTHALNRMRPLDYRQWFYDYTYMLRWGQVTVPSGGNGDRMNEQGIADGIGSTMYHVLLSTREIQNIVDNHMSDSEKAANQYIKALTYPLEIYMLLLDTDMYGDRAYTEAFMSRYTNPPLLTPKFDTQEDLLNIALERLDATIKTLSNPIMHEGKAVSQISLGKQDFVYNGDVKKWAKFANALKLKVAVRLLHVDKEKAFKIAQEVVSSPAGLPATLDDDFVWNPGSKEYHFNDDINPGVISAQLCDFMIENKDPRVRFFFQKNHFSSTVIQAFYDAKAENDKMPEVPPFIEQYVNFSVDGHGHKHFESWKAPGEPWVRYFGVPSHIDANLEEAYTHHFNPQGTLNKITLNGKEQSYSPLSFFNAEMMRGNLIYTFPEIPGVVVQDKEPKPWYGMYLSSAEVALYLAELKTLGANIAVSAADQFAKAVELSVRAYDKLAGLNMIPYYSEPHDKQHGKAIKLVNGEVEALLQQDAYKLTGDRASDLEKIYLQEHIHFILLPADMYVAMRRSGVPMLESTLLPFKRMKKDGSYYPLARRFNVTEPLQSNKMYSIILDSYKRQGFTMSTTDVTTLEKERVWYDQKAPDFGKGPNL